jgi:hypothetical protein
MNKFMKPIVMMIAAVGIAVATLPKAADEEIDTVPATRAALAWLAIVDTGQYAKSWESTTEFFRSGVTETQWETMLAPARAKMGNFVARKAKYVQYVRDLPKAPPGDYVVIQYSSRFENGLFTETVTPMKQADGSWKVAGYYISK